jgi:hypothetical protein
MDGNTEILKRYSGLLRTYVEMRQQLVDLLRLMDEEEIAKETSIQRTASEMLDMAFDYMDEAREQLEPIDKLMVSVKPLFFGYSALTETSFHGDNDLDDLRDLLNGLNLDLD